MRAAGGFAHHYTGDTALVTIEGVESRRLPVLRKYLTVTELRDLAREARADLSPGHQSGPAVVLG